MINAAQYGNRGLKAQATARCRNAFSEQCSGGSNQAESQAFAQLMLRVTNLLTKFKQA